MRLSKLEIQTICPKSSEGSCKDHNFETGSLDSS
jgi:hypothetical protein